MDPDWQAAGWREEWGPPPQKLKTVERIAMARALLAKARNELSERIGYVVSKKRQPKPDLAAAHTRLNRMLSEIAPIASITGVN